ncbi:Uncharacterised protein [Serratia proteamaculans]|nr:Uncharacterised protein [Serratia proteamaculans]CAI0817955.1 Uncharacterised protein [Serratia proteamaculans]CAI0819541.1 Uncharacterised protein [Serratia proteamaculans]CAI2067958.1 Uncharacterised protein [Serratia proteamaculans]CAI2423171.1 Uncharacterised protein [Serratia proteamaculans]
MKRLIILYLTFFIVIFTVQIISGSGVTYKSIGYSLLGSGVWMFFSSVISRLSQKEK